MSFSTSLRPRERKGTNERAPKHMTSRVEYPVALVIFLFFVFGVWVSCDAWVAPSLPWVRHSHGRLVGLGGGTKKDAERCGRRGGGSFVVTVMNVDDAPMRNGKGYGRRIPTGSAGVSFSFTPQQQQRPENEWVRGNDRGMGRRDAMLAVAGGIVTVTTTSVSSSHATSNPSSSLPEVTDRIYLEFSGLSSSAEGPQSSSSSSTPPRIVIGLYGKDAPQPVSILKGLVSDTGLLGVPCKERPVRTLQREQLEANKVYDACLEQTTLAGNGNEVGVTYDRSTVWRIDRDRRIDVGSVSGKFGGREYPDFRDTDPPSRLRHDLPGTVSVRRGNDGGFGFTILPSYGTETTTTTTVVLDEDNIVVGRVLDGMEVVAQINETPVVRTSASVNYMSLTGASPQGRNAPSKACRYGGPMYCNELKPLRKITVVKCGII